MEVGVSARTKLGRLVESPYFKGCSFGLILVSAVILGLDTSPFIRSQYGHTMHAVENAIIWLFTAELSLRIAAYGKRWPRFFASGWNIFDFVVVALCFFPSIGQLSAVARLARVLRAMRLLSVLPNLQLLIEALLKSFASMGYVALLLSMVFYVYGILGVGLYAELDGEHFGSLSAACLTLFEILTLEGWVDVMTPLQGAYPVCAPLFFVSFILLGTMIVLNLFIGVIVNGMSEAQAEILMEKAKRDGNEMQEVLQSIEEQFARIRILLDAKADAVTSLPEPAIAPYSDRHPDPR